MKCYARGFLVLLFALVTDAQKSRMLPPISQIENFAASDGIKPEQLLILDISGNLAKLSFHTGASLLLGDAEHLDSMNYTRQK